MRALLLLCLLCRAAPDFRNILIAFLYDAGKDLHTHTHGGAHPPLYIGNVN